MIMRLLLVPIILLLAGCSSPQKPAALPVAKPPEPVRILMFYAAGQAYSGEPVTLCYGVENARSVRVEPPVEQLKPAYSRCFQVSPRVDTAYTLIAEGSDGSTATQSIMVKVLTAIPSAPPAVRPSLIRTFAASAEVVSSGAPIILCYSAPDATSVTIDPPVRELEPTDRLCFSTRVATTTTYKLTATGAGGKKEAETLTVKVR
jgi:hypothetical protein